MDSDAAQVFNREMQKRMKDTYVQHGDLALSQNSERPRNRGSSKIFAYSGEQRSTGQGNVRRKHQWTSSGTYMETAV